jgi:hypothetical protein
MFDAIIGWLGGAWGWLKWLIDEIWNQAKAALTSVWAVVVLVAGWIWAILENIVSSVTALISKIDQLAFPDVSPGMPGSLSYVAKVANTFFPLQEAFVYLTAFVVLLLALTGYRFIKSWIPTLS